MSRLRIFTAFVAAALAGLLTGCGHAPLTAHATPHPIMLGPVQRLPGGLEEPSQDASGVETGRFAATASSRLEVTSTPTYAGTYTVSTQSESLSSVLDAAAIDAVQGDAHGRLTASDVACNSVVLYALFYVYAEEQCTIAGGSERPRAAPATVAE